MSAQKAVQIALRSVLIADAPVLALVPAASIFDRLARPESFPCIVLGEGQVFNDFFLADRSTRTVVSTLHIWTREPGLSVAMDIADAIETAILAAYPLQLDPPYSMIDIIADQRFLRDPDGETGHGVVTFESNIRGVG